MTTDEQYQRLQEENQAIARSPVTTVTRYGALPPVHVTPAPVVRVSQSTLLERVLATPAPVPARDAITIERQRLEAAQEKSTPITRAVASVIRSGKYLLAIALTGIIAYAALPTVPGVTIFFVTMIVMALVMLAFDQLEYQHSQPGVERLRSKQDHRLERDHERNRHRETMVAMSSDLQLKTKAIDAAISAFDRRISE